MKIALITTYPDAPEVYRLIEEASALGHSLKVVNFDDFGFEVFGDKLSLLGKTNWDFDLVIIRGVFLAIRALTPFVTFLHEKGIKVFDNNLSVHKYAIDKTSDFVKLAINKLPMPNTAYSRASGSFLKNAKKIGFPVILKSVRMGKGASVVKIDDEKSLKEYLKKYEEAEGYAKDLVMQEFIDYKFDLRVFVLGNKLFSMRRIPPANDFRANFSLGGTVEPFELSYDLKELSLKSTAAVDLQIAGVDILLDQKNKPYILEVNHTPGMSGIEKATNENITKMYLEYAISHAK